MKTRLYSLLIVAFLSSPLAFAQGTAKPPQAPQQPPQPSAQPSARPSAEDRRILEEEQRRRDAQEADRVQQTFDRLENIHRLPLTPEEIEARRKKRLPQFLKDLEGFKVTSAEIAGYGPQPPAKALKELHSKAKTLERLVDDLVDYVMDGEDPPDPRNEDYAAMPLPERLGMLNSMAPSIHKRLKETYKAPLVDVDSQIELLEDLQAAKLLSHSLRK